MDLKVLVYFNLMLLIIYLMKLMQPLDADGDIHTHFMELTFKE